jgi:hypothetical protein
LFINRDNLREAIRLIVNATLKARDTVLWGEGTSCASDSRKFGSWSATSCRSGLPRPHSRANPCLADIHASVVIADASAVPPAANVSLNIPALPPPALVSCPAIATDTVRITPITERS